MESSIWVLSREAYMYIFNIINNDNDVLLESVSNILAHVNSSIKCDDGRDFWITEPLIFTAMRLSKVKCIRWLFSHGTSPRLQDGGQSLLAQAFIYGHEQLVLDKGVPLELCANDWFELSMRTKPLSLRFVKDCANFIHLDALRKILHYGIVIPLGNPCVHPDIYKAYEIMLARVEACRQTCRVFIHAGILPKDITKWMLYQYVWPSRRESIWSPPHVKMPRGFE